MSGSRRWLMRSLEPLYPQTRFARVPSRFRASSPEDAQGTSCGSSTSPASRSQRSQTARVVLWAIHADVRSLGPDIATLEGLLRPFSREDRAVALRKLTIVLTKADLLSPGPWLIALDGGDANKRMQTILNPRGGLRTPDPGR